ncbi:MAG: glycoside hydrolase family 9 protein [Acidobacteriota bacterium]
MLLNTTLRPLALLAAMLSALLAAPLTAWAGGCVSRGLPCTPPDLPMPDLSDMDGVVDLDPYLEQSDRWCEATCQHTMIEPGPSGEGLRLHFDSDLGDVVDGIQQTRIAYIVHLELPPQEVLDLTSYTRLRFKARMPAFDPDSAEPFQRFGYLSPALIVDSLLWQDSKNSYSSGPLDAGEDWREFIVPLDRNWLLEPRDPSAQPFTTLAFQSHNVGHMPDESDWTIIDVKDFRLDQEPVDHAGWEVPENVIRIPSSGFAVGHEKIAFANANLFEHSFEIVNVDRPDDPPAATGQFGLVTSELVIGGGPESVGTAVADFSYSLVAEGNYILRTTNDDGEVLESRVFHVGPEAYQESIRLVTDYVDGMRCGVDNKKRPACHTDDGTVDGLSISASGGWHDGGDSRNFYWNSYEMPYHLLRAREAAGDLAEREELLALARHGLEHSTRTVRPVNGELLDRTMDSANYWTDEEVGTDDDRPIVVGEYWTNVARLARSAGRLCQQDVSSGACRLVSPSGTTCIITSAERCDLISGDYAGDCSCCPNGCPNDLAYKALTLAKQRFDGFACKEVDCGDSLDNDLDSLADCLDLRDCCSQGRCAGTLRCLERNACGDTLDNDGDGLVDCFDVADCGDSWHCGGIAPWWQAEPLHTNHAFKLAHEGLAALQLHLAGRQSASEYLDHAVDHANKLEQLQHDDFRLGTTHDFKKEWTGFLTRGPKPGPDTDLAEEFLAEMYLELPFTDCEDGPVSGSCGVTGTPCSVDYRIALRRAAEFWMKPVREAWGPYSLSQLVQSGADLNTYETEASTLWAEYSGGNPLINYHLVPTGGYKQLADTAMALNRVARALDDPELDRLARRQVQWALGLNPSGTTFIADQEEGSPTQFYSHTQGVMRGAIATFGLGADGRPFSYSGAELNAVAGSLLVRAMTVFSEPARYELQLGLAGSPYRGRIEIYSEPDRRLAWSHTSTGEPLEFDLDGGRKYSLEALDAGVTVPLVAISGQRYERTIELDEVLLLEVEAPPRVAPGEDFQVKLGLRQNGPNPVQRTVLLKASGVTLRDDDGDDERGEVEFSVGGFSSTNQTLTFTAASDYRPYLISFWVEEEGSMPAPMNRQPVIVDATGIIQKENCTNGVNDDPDVDELTDCEDPVCAAHPVCSGEWPLCDNGLDDDRDGLTDCADPDCRGHASCRELGNCSDNIDNDGDGRVDCDDTDCCGLFACRGRPPCF